MALFASCLTVIVLTFLDWQSNPSLLIIDENKVNVWQFPAPAVTICPNRKLSNTFSWNYQILSKCLVMEACDLDEYTYVVICSNHKSIQQFVSDKQEIDYTHFYAVVSHWAKWFAVTHEI